jgi:hypothetical protein
MSPKHAVLWAAVLAGCASSDPVDEAEPPLSGPAGLARELGLDLYLDATPAASVDETDGVTTTTFDVAAGPRCLRGDPFRAATREGASDDLLVFLQGGGACHSEFCLAVTKAPPGIPLVDVLDPGLADNPFRDFDVAYAPYCDGSLFTGDGEVDDDGDGQTDRHHRGLANLSATLNVAKAAFPAPPRVVLGGSSGGAYGTALVRATYPDAEILVLADSGTGIARGPDDPVYLETMLGEHGSLRFFPDSCEGCLASGHVTGLTDWWLQRDDNTRIAVFASWYDYIIGDVFLQIPPDTHRDLLAEETAALHEAYPDRYRRFLVDGRDHTTLLGDASGLLGGDLTALEVPAEILPDLVAFTAGSLETTELEGVRISAWLEGFVADDDQVWMDLTAEPGPVPGDE